MKKETLSRVPVPPRKPPEREKEEKKEQTDKPGSSEGSEPIHPGYVQQGARKP